jgi:hypothetical protein
MKLKTLLILAVSPLLFCSCNHKLDEMQQQAFLTFGDQYFKTAISLVELYKVRHGHYPQTFKEIDFTGDFDPAAFNSIQYKKLEDGYELDVVPIWTEKSAGKAQKIKDSLYLIHNIKYPAAFWKGLGIKKSNLMPEK